MLKRFSDISFDSTVIAFIFIALTAIGSIDICFAEAGYGYSNSNPRQNNAGPVIVNGHEMTPEQQMEFFRTYGSAPIPGDYWYDSKSGLYGYIGGPAISTIILGQNFGAMPPNASQGDTGVYLNGRQLPKQELQVYVMILGEITPGHYWMDAMGNLGRAGESKTLSQSGQVQQYSGINEASAAQSAQSPSTTSTTAATAGNTRLVGVFAGESVSSSGMGDYFNTQMNWAFNADGTVLYGAQSQYSASERDYDGNLDWSASGQTAGNVDRGRWRTSGDLLTIQWDDGEVSRYAYGIEPDGTLVYRHPETRKLINYFPRIR